MQFLGSKTHYHYFFKPYKNTEQACVTASELGLSRSIENHMEQNMKKKEKDKIPRAEQHGIHK